ncbi:MAG: HNH endonuclease [Planctomycetes bacterium]|nr:HNH endonuclease [Planctomycetota bacterium]
MVKSYSFGGIKVMENNYELQDDFPENWNEIRRAIYKRDKYTCQECGESNCELHCHHVQPRRVGGSNYYENLITLCEHCHHNQNVHTCVWKKPS